MKIQISFVGCLALFLASCASIGRHGKIEPAPKVDLSRYMGPWHVIAFMDNKVERDFFNAVETYQLRGSNQIDVHFKWNDKGFDGPLKTHDFTGRVVSDGTNANWKMRLFPVFTVGYIIVDVPPDYSRVAVAHPSRSSAGSWPVTDRFQTRTTRNTCGFSGGSVTTRQSSSELRSRQHP